MNSLIILFVLPLLIIFSYLFDAFSRKTKFPSVILLMFTGIVVRVISNAYGIEKLGFLDDLIPVLGTVGLILIVLEGALELEIKREKLEKERLEEKMTKEEERREKLSLKPLLEVGEEVYAAWCK